MFFQSNYQTLAEHHQAPHPETIITYLYDSLENHSLEVGSVLFEQNYN